MISITTPCYRKTWKPSCRNGDLPKTKADIKGTSLLVSLAFYVLEN